MRDDEEDNGRDDGNSSAPSNSDDAVPVVVPPARDSLTGVVLGTLFFSATAFGAIQI